MHGQYGTEHRDDSEQNAETIRNGKRGQSVMDRGDNPQQNIGTIWKGTQGQFGTQGGDDLKHGGGGGGREMAWELIL